MIKESIPINQELYDKIKTGQVTEININGYNGYQYIYELVTIKKEGKVYKLERNN